MYYFQWNTPLSVSINLVELPNSQVIALLINYGNTVSFSHARLNLLA